MKQEKLKEIPDISLSGLDELQFRLHCGVEAVGAVHELIAGSGTCAPECYADALFGTYCYLSVLNDELQEIVNKAAARRIMTV